MRERRDWHGIPADILTEAAKMPFGKLMIAKRRPASIRVYCAPLKQFLEHEDQLPRTVRGERHFNLAWRGDHPYVSEIRDLRLELLTEIDCSEETREGDPRRRELLRALAALSNEERQELLKSLSRSPS